MNASCGRAWQMLPSFMIKTDHKIFHLMCLAWMPLPFMKGLDLLVIRYLVWVNWHRPLRLLSKARMNRLCKQRQVWPKLILSQKWLVNFLNYRASWVVIMHAIMVKKVAWLRRLLIIINLQALQTLCLQHLKGLWSLWLIKLIRWLGFLALAQSQQGQKIPSLFVVLLYLSFV